MSIDLCDDCFKSVRHEGTPEGKIEDIGGVTCYVATPDGEYAKEKVVLFLADVFGLALQNNKLLADDFARNGFKTIIPDYFNGDPVPSDAHQPGSTFKMDVWRPKHGPEQTRPPLDAVIAALRQEGVAVFGATGYCFGARYSVDLALDGVTKAIAVAHPSMLQVPGDFEAMLAKSKNPLLINSCETDSQFPPEKQKIADELLGGGKYAPGYERTYWDGCSHGFAVRGDMSNPKVKAGKEGAFKATVEFFRKHL